MGVLGRVALVEVAVLIVGSLYDRRSLCTGTCGAQVRAVGAGFTTITIVEYSAIGT